MDMSFHPEEWHTFIHQTFKEGQHYPQHATPRTVRVPTFLKLKVNAETQDMHPRKSKQFRLKSKVPGEE